MPGQSLLAESFNGCPVSSCPVSSCPVIPPASSVLHCRPTSIQGVWGMNPPTHPRPRKLKDPDTCPFPTPASPRYHISRGVGCLGSFPWAIPLPAQMAQNDTEKTFLLKTAGPLPLPSGGDKTGQNQDITGTKPDIDRTKADKTPPAPRSNVRKCPLLSDILSFSASPTENWAASMTRQ